jgi:hypothetical protein
MAKVTIGEQLPPDHPIYSEPPQRFSPDWVHRLGQSKTGQQPNTAGPTVMQLIDAPEPTAPTKVLRDFVAKYGQDKEAQRWLGQELVLLVKELERRAAQGDQEAVL